MNVINVATPTILVTGGAGFIGSNLIRKIRENHPSYSIVSLDNYFTGTKENHIEGITYLEGDTKDIDYLVTVQPDIVFHLGEYSRVEKSFEDVEKVFEFNKIGTFHVLEFCRKHGSKLVYAGSSTKFGDGGLGRDQSPYAWTKATNTELIINYGKWYGLKYAIAYFYNVYGKNEIRKGDYATVIGIFKEKFLAKQPLTVVTPGTQKRNFTHVDDITNGLLLVGEKGEGDNYGLGAEESYAIIDIARMFTSDIVMLPERQGNRMEATIDVSRSKNELGWSAKINIKDHIAEFIASPQ